LKSNCLLIPDVRTSAHIAIQPTKVGSLFIRHCKVPNVFLCLLCFSLQSKQKPSKQ